MSRISMLRISMCLALAMFAFPTVGRAKIGFRQLTTIHPVAVQRGTQRKVRVRSNFTLDETYAAFFDKPGISMKFTETKPIKAPRKGRASIGTPFRFDVSVPEDQPTGVYEVRVATRQAVSSVSHLLVTDFPVVEETKQGNDVPQSAQAVPLPVAICGVCEKTEDVDCFRFAGKRGQRITAQVYAQRVTECIHIMLVKHPIYHMNPVLTLIGPSGQIVAENDNYYGGDSFLNCQLPETGDYVVRIRDVRYAGSEKFVYCVEVSDRPFLKAVFPLAVQAGKTIAASPVGFGFDGAATAKITGATKAAGQWTRFRFQGKRGQSNQVPLLVSHRRQYAVPEGSDSLKSATEISLPCGISGRIAKPETGQFYSFDAAKGQRFLFELEAHRHGLPLDGLIEIFDDKGKKLAEGDDAAGSPLAWSWTAKDSRLRFQAPSAGRYYVSIRDLNGRGGDHFVYYLRVENDAGDFEVFGEYYYAMLAPGTNMLWFARINRLNGFQGPVQMGIEGLPPGVRLVPVTIPAGMNHCALILSADKKAQINASLVRVFGKAKVKDGQKATREIVRYGKVTCELQQGGGSAQIRWPCKTQIVGVTKPLDLVRVEATPARVTLAPGQTAEIKVRLVRRKGNTDPVTLALSHMYYTNSCGDQLPPGVTLSPSSRTQLKGSESEATIVLAAAKNALPVKDLPIAIMARVYVTYNISTNYASTPVMLTVKPAR